MKKVLLVVLCTVLLACVFTTVTATAITYNWNTVLIGDVYYSGVDETSGQDSAAVTGVENHEMYSIVVPEYVTYQGTTYPVKYILSYGYASCGNAVSLNVHSGITQMGSGVFADCTSLKEITIPFVGETPDGFNKTHFGHIFIPSYYNIHSNAPGYQEGYVPQSIKKVTVTGGRKIAYNAFLNCKYIEEIVLGEGIKEIESSAFSRCYSLHTVTIPKSVTELTQGAFYECESLSRIRCYRGTAGETVAKKLGVEIEYLDKECAVHSFGEPVTVLNPSCVIEGSAVKTCTVCGVEETVLLPIIEHTFSEWTVQQPATCALPGVESRYCTYCIQTETREIPVQNHVFGSLVTTTMPTCLESGVATATCATCGQTAESILAPLGHIYSAPEIIQNATTYSCGYSESKCNNCTDIQKTIIPATGINITNGAASLMPGAILFTEEINDFANSSIHQSVITEISQKTDRFTVVNISSQLNGVDVLPMDIMNIFITTPDNYSNNIKVFSAIPEGTNILTEQAVEILEDGTVILNTALCGTYVICDMDAVPNAPNDDSMGGNISGNGGIPNTNIPGVNIPTLDQKFPNRAHDDTIFYIIIGGLGFLLLVCIVVIIVLAKKLSAFKNPQDPLDDYPTEETYDESGNEAEQPVESTEAPTEEPTEEPIETSTEASTSGSIEETNP